MMTPSPANPDRRSAAAAESSAPAQEAPRHPAIELLARYKAIFQAAWALRHEMAGPKRLADEAAFLPAALSLQESPLHPAPRRLAWATMILFVIALVWSIFGKVDIVAVAQGRVIVAERTKLIQPLERSVVKRILVKDGDTVAEGQALVELDPTSASADKASIQEQLKASSADAVRASVLQASLAKLPANGNMPANSLSNSEHSAQISYRLAAQKPLKELLQADPGFQASVIAQTQAEWSDISAKLAKLSAEIMRRQAEINTVREQVAKLETTVPLARQREEDFKRLSDQGFVASHAGQDRTRERIELERDLATQRAKLLESQAILQETLGARTAYLAETRRALSEREAQAELKRQQAAQESTKATQREQLTTLRAPVAGTVQQLAIHSIGGVVTEAQALMVIVPSAAAGQGVIAEVTLDNKDIGFVNAGQEAAIKLETFPFTRYGILPAQVQWVTADAVLRDKRGEGGSAESAVFPAKLDIKASHILIDGKRIALTPGMNLTAEIKTGQRRVIEYLLSPIQKAGSESLRER
jgi:hemolysin D